MDDHPKKQHTGRDHRERERIDTDPSAERSRTRGRLAIARPRQRGAQLAHTREIAGFVRALGERELLAFGGR